MGAPPAANIITEPPPIYLRGFTAATAAPTVQIIFFLSKGRENLLLMKEGQMPQSHRQTAKQGPRQCTKANRPGKIHRQQQLAKHLRAIGVRRVANGAPRRSLQLRARLTPGYQVILFKEDGYIKAQESTFLSLPHQAFRLVAIQSRGEDCPSALPNINDDSSSSTSSNCSTEGSNFPNWRYYEDKGSHNNNTSSIATEASNKANRQGAGNNLSHHGHI